MGAHLLGFTQAKDYLLLAEADRTAILCKSIIDLLALDQLVSSSNLQVRQDNFSRSKMNGDFDSALSVPFYSRTKATRT